MEVDSALPRNADPIDICFRNITYNISVKNGHKEPVKKATGVFRAGELTAIMGPSGAGKTTLLNILTGFLRNGVEGKIDERDIGQRNKVEEHSRYVLRDDFVDGFFTVEETMNFSVSMNIGRDFNADLAKNITDVVGLTDVFKTRCSSLSRGEKKRLSIAAELVVGPSVIFCYEPTTGLDSAASYRCLSALKSIAKTGRTVVCSIRQPSAVEYALFDKVYVLVGGECAYEGSSQDTLGFLETFGLTCPDYHNPADFLMEVINGEYGNNNYKLIRLTSAKRKFDRPKSSKTVQNPEGTVIAKSASAFSQIYLLSARSFVRQRRDWTLLYLKIILHLFASGVLALVFFECGSSVGAQSMKNVAFFFVGLTYFTFATMMMAQVRFSHEIQSIRKEIFNNWYTLNMYYAASLLSDTLVQVVFAIFFGTLSYLMTFQPWEASRFFMYVLVYMIVSIIAESTGRIIGTLFDPTIAACVGSAVAGVQILFAGFFAHLSHMFAFMRYLTYGSSLYHGLSALMIGAYGYGRKPLECPEEELYCSYKYPITILKEMDMDGNSYWVNIAALVIISICLEFFAYFTLKRKLSKAAFVRRRGADSKFSDFSLDFDFNCDFDCDFDCCDCDFDCDFDCCDCDFD